ncbi:MAG: JAB domain-containing protein [Burkholderiaceae bacterium]
MNLASLDRNQLESILLDPPVLEPEPLRCSDQTAVAYLPERTGERATRIRHVLAAAHEILVRVAAQALVGRTLFDSMSAVKDFLKILFAGAERETFVVIFLDSLHRVICSEEMFAGTVNHTSVHPREVVKRAMHLNAAAIICAHSHPSGSSLASRSDEMLTQQLKSALALVDVRLIDHYIVAGSFCNSFAERGML